MNRNLIIGGLVGILALSGAWYVFAGTPEPVKEPVALCPVVAEIFDKKLGSTTALTKGTIGCVKIEEYLIAGWKQGIAPAWHWDKGKMTNEEYFETINKIASLYGITQEEYDRKGDIVFYDKVREAALAKGEIVEPTRTIGEFVIK